MSNLCQKFLPLAALALAAGLLSPQAAQASYEQYAKEYGNNRVRVQLRVPGGAAQEWFVTGVNGNMIEVALANGDAMALSTEDPSLQGRLGFQAADNTRLSTLLNARNYEAAQQLLRPTVYPLFKFSDLPAGYVQFYDPIDTLIGALIGGGQLVEAAEILTNNKGLLSQERFQRRIFGLIEGLGSAGQSSEAVKLLALIPLDQVPQGLKNSLLTFAYRLRVEGEYEALIPVYESMIPMLEGAQKAEAEIWLAYCLINTGQREKGAAILNAMPQPEPGDESFGLYQLLSGYSLYQSGDFAGALDVFSRGLVYASSVDTWIPEISFYIGNCYRELGKTVAARNTYTEIFRLWPENPWAKRARAAFDAIAEPAAPAVPAASASQAPATSPAT